MADGVLFISYCYFVILLLCCCFARAQTTESSVHLLLLPFTRFNSFRNREQNVSHCACFLWICVIVFCVFHSIVCERFSHLDFDLTAHALRSFSNEDKIVLLFQICSSKPKPVHEDSETKNKTKLFIKWNFYDLCSSSSGNKFILYLFA